MNALTKFFLILLRLAIGWHLLFAGIAKFQPDYKGSEGYLQNSGGPLAPMFHSMIGDQLADKLAADPDASKAPKDRLPPATRRRMGTTISTLSPAITISPLTSATKRKRSWIRSRTKPSSG